MSIYVDVSDKVIDDDLAFNFVQSEEHGAQVSFKGIVRNSNHGKKVISVAYDAFEPLAKKVLWDIANEGIVKYKTNFKIAIIHRTGNLKVKEASLLVVASSKHRDEAFDIVRYVVEELKVRVPIWKREFYENGETEWLRGHTLCRHSSGRREVHAHGAK